MMKTTKGFHRIVCAASLVVVCLTAQVSPAASYDEVFSFAQVAGSTGSTFNFGAAVDGSAVYFSVNSPAGITKVDGSGTSVVLTPTDWAAASGGATGLTTWYAFENMGDYLVFGESSADQVWKVEKATGAISAVATTTDIQAVTGLTKTSLLASKGTLGDDYYCYEGESDSILKVNVPTGAVSMVATKAQLDTFIDSTKVSGGLAFDAAGAVYFGETTADGIFKWDGASGSTVLSVSEITAVSGGADASFGDILYGEDGLMYFSETKSASILSFDPANPAATLGTVLSKDDLLAGPMAGSNISGLAWYDGRLAFTGMGKYGFYSVPEPATFGLLLGMLGLALLRRRSK